MLMNYYEPVHSNNFKLLLISSSSVSLNFLKRLNQ